MLAARFQVGLFPIAELVLTPSRAQLVMAEERSLLAHPLLPFLPQQWRKQSPESVVAPNSGTRLAPGGSGRWPPSPSPGARSCLLLEPPTQCLCPRRSSAAFPGAEVSRGVPVWTAVAFKCGCPHLILPKGSLLSLLGDVCRALGCALADSGCAAPDPRFVPQQHGCMPCSLLSSQMCLCSK